MLGMPQKSWLEGLRIVEEQALMSSLSNTLVSGFFDESGKFSSTEAVAFGGCFGLTETWIKFTEQWEKRLTKDGLSHTSMKEAIHYDGPFSSRAWTEIPERRDALLLDLASIILNLPLVRIAAPMTSAEFKALPPSEQKLYIDLQYCGFEACLKGVLEDQRQKFLFNMTCDLSSEYAETCVSLFQRVRDRNQQARQRCIGIAFLDDEYCYSLQAADMIAYCARAEKIEDRSKEHPTVTKLVDLFASQDRVHKKMTYKAGSLGLGDGEIQS